jgi:hypothetical protein
MAKNQHNDLDVEPLAKPLSAASSEDSPLGPQAISPQREHPFQPQEPAPDSRMSGPVERQIRSSPRETAPPTMDRMERQRHRLRPIEEMPAESVGSRMHIDRSEWPDGFSLQWVTKSIYGQEQPSHTSSFYRRGWEPVWGTDFEHRFDGRWAPVGHQGPIDVDGMILCARDARWSEKAAEDDRRKAHAALAVKEAQLKGGQLEGVGMDGGSRHPSALAVNRIRKTTERLQVPRDGE